MHARGYIALWINGLGVACGPDRVLECLAGVPQQIRSLNKALSGVHVTIPLAANLDEPLTLVLMTDSGGARDIEFAVTYATAAQELRCTGTCSDGIRNGLEVEVDCGGSCQPCVKVTLPDATARNGDSDSDNDSNPRPVSGMRGEPTNSMAANGARGSTAQNARIMSDGSASMIANAPSGNNDTLVIALSAAFAGLCLLVLCILIVIALVKRSKRRNEETGSNQSELGDVQLSARTEQYQSPRFDTADDSTYSAISPNDVRQSGVSQQSGNDVYGGIYLGPSLSSTGSTGNNPVPAVGLYANAPSSAGDVYQSPLSVDAVGAGGEHQDNNYTQMGMR